jgi:hypothetical protein
VSLLLIDICGQHGVSIMNVMLTVCSFTRLTGDRQREAIVSTAKNALQTSDFNITFDLINTVSLCSSK